MAFIVFGAIDYCAEIGVTPGDEALAYARGRLVQACAGRVGVIDVPCIDFRDNGEVERQSNLARRLGFCGKAAIHPSNIETINRVFSPSPAELAEARAVISAFRSSNGAATTLDGKLVERPIIRRMERLLKAAGEDCPSG
jgi:citrate lyase beta subunit